MTRIDKSQKTSLERGLPETADFKQLNSLQKKAVTLPEQWLVNALETALPRVSDMPDKLSIIKNLFFNRDFMGLFTDTSLLMAYTLEYVPSRSLCYRDIFMKLEHLTALFYGSNVSMTCLGAGNGAEFLGLAGALLARPLTNSITLNIQDLSLYDPVMPLLTSSLKVDGLQVHSMPLGDLTSLEYLESISQTIKDSKIITAMFLLNELLTTSKSGFARFISSFIQTLSRGTFFLVVDSAGSFSELQLGDQKIMLFKLLDAISSLRIVESFDSTWYRPPPLTSSVKLQNMRYYLRLYQKK